MALTLPAKSTPPFFSVKRVEVLESIDAEQLQQAIAQLVAAEVKQLADAQAVDAARHQQDRAVLAARLEEAQVCLECRTAGPVCQLAFFH